MEVLLDEDKHYDEIRGYLAPKLSKENITNLGITLGLKITRLEGKAYDLEDMIEDWLKMQDDVMVKTGEPTWSTLVEALKEIGQNDVATHIKNIKGSSKLFDHMLGKTGEPEKNVEMTTVGETAKSGDVSQAGAYVMDQQSQLGGDDRIQSDLPWPFKKTRGKKKEEFDGLEKEQFDRIQFDSAVKIKLGQHFLAIDRGQHKACLKLEDEDKDVKTIIPKSATQKPYSYLGYYPMKSKKHGVAMIINNKQFDSEKHRTRTGTDRDEDNLIETWKFLGYHVVVFKDCKRDTMAQLLLNIDEEILNDAQDVEHDSFVCCILSHGKEGIVFGSDSRPLEHNQIQRFLAKSEKLRRRPKMIFIQAC